MQNIDKQWIKLRAGDTRKTSGYLSEFKKQAANRLVTETLQYFVFFRSEGYRAISAKCLITNVLRLNVAILFFIAFLNITYTARHSWASIAKTKNISIGIISEAMGHDSETTTQIYLSSIQTNQIDNANRNILKDL